MSNAKMTAEFASAIRALGSFEREVTCPDYLARKLISFHLRLAIAKPFRKITKDILNKQFPHLYAFHIVRNIHIDTILFNLLKDRNVEQVVFLGAGFDTRAIRFSRKFNRVQFFELDFPHTQDHKLKQLERVKRSQSIDDSHTTYIPIDFNKTAPFDLLKEHNYSLTKKTLIIWEGVTMYLPEETISSVLSNIRENTASGSYLTFDYLAPENLPANNQQGGNYVSKIDEEYIWGISPKELPVYVGRFGYQVIENLTPTDLNKKYLNYAEDTSIRNGLSEKVTPSIALLET